VCGYPAEEVSFKQLYRAWKMCQKRKSGTPAAQRYEMNLLDNLLDTLNELQEGEYQTTTSYCFLTQKPKLREIHAANFRDRVVHHLLVPQLEKIWEPKFIFDLYSNRKGKGTHQTVKRLQQWMRKSDAHCYLQLDIKNFFYSINQEVLLALLQKGLKQACRRGLLTFDRAAFLESLCRLFIQNGGRDAVALDKRHSTRVPLHKQLSCQPEGQGLPIGNLTSQFFANVYLTTLRTVLNN